MNHPRTVFSGPCNAAHYNHNNIDCLVQTEAPLSMTIRGWRPPARSKKFAIELASRYGGEWTYVPGYGCPGGWSVDCEDHQRQVAIARSFDATIVVYVYPGTDVPSMLRDQPCYVNKNGFYSTPVIPTSLVCSS